MSVGTVKVATDWGVARYQSIVSFRAIKNDATKEDRKLTDEVKDVLGDGDFIVIDYEGKEVTLFSVQEARRSDSYDVEAIKKQLVALGVDLDIEQEPYLVKGKVDRRLIVVKNAIPSEPETIPEPRKGLRARLPL